MMSQTVVRSRASLVYTVAVLLALALTGLFLFTLWPNAQTLYVRVGEDLIPVTVHGRRVADVLRELGVPLRPEDRVIPAPEAPVYEGMTITIAYARPVVIDVAGQRRLHFTQATRVRDILAEAGVTLQPQDAVWLNGRPVTGDALLPPAVWRRPAPTAAWVRVADPVVLRVQRRVPLLVTDEGMTYTIWTTAATVGEALHRAGVALYLGDEVRPGLGTRVSAYLRVTIRRSTPIIVEADGQVWQTRTRAATVADALAAQGIFLTGWDRVTPPLATPLRPGLRIRVTRVEEVIEIEDERIPFETAYVPDDTLEIDTRRVITEGRPGIYRRRYRVRLEDGVEVSRVLEDAWMAQEPITHVIAYGRKIVTRTLETPDGPIVYWRRIRMLATSYSASTAGVDPSRPWYGITRLGLPMRRGIVAVDPRVIPLGTQVYVPGYGKGLAADTGSRILGRRIDLGYNDWDLVLWNQWVDVYLLAPPPPPDKINYLIPNWPRPPP